jgi:Flp pilus assembly pilin Flp
MIRKFRAFLKDESAAATIEYIVLTAGIAVVIMTAMKPGSHLRTCRTCGRPMRFLAAIAKFGRHPELRTYDCERCDKTVVEEWTPRESGSRRRPNSRQGARTLARGLMVLRKRCGIGILDIIVMFGTWAGSIAFGWYRQPFWLAVPPVICIGYTLVLVGRNNAWMARELRLARLKLFEMWISGRAAGLSLSTLLRTLSWAGVGSVVSKKQDDPFAFNRATRRKQ